MNDLNRMSYQELKDSLAYVDKKIEYIEEQMRKEESQDTPDEDLIASLEFEAEQDGWQRDAIANEIEAREKFVKEALKSHPEKGQKC
ncbi:hypothetical protein [Megamonas hypermegale]|uniref:hypothetical protein n=1 Tax=Megamonas hypermegale TaxID=158847 RepID=UPI0026EE4147|nr:hypothetical protein [Megamonas hypermegale]